MGFLKKKPHIKLPNGADMARTASSKSLLPTDVISPPALSPVTATIAEERDEGPFDADTGDVTTSKAEPRASAPSSGSKETRENPVSEPSSSGGEGGPQQKKATSREGGKKSSPSSSAAAKTGKKDVTRHNSRGSSSKPSSAGDPKSRHRATSPFKKKSSSDKKKKKKTTLDRSRSASAGLGRMRRGRSLTPTTPKGGKKGEKVKSPTLSDLKKKQISASTRSKMTDATRRVANNGKTRHGKSSKHSNSRSTSKQGHVQGERPRPASAPSGNIKKRLQQHYDEMSSSSSGSESSYGSSYDEDDTEVEDSTMYTNESFLTMGFTDDSQSYDTGVGESNSLDTDINTDDEEGMEVSPSSFRSRGTKGFSSSFESGTKGNNTRASTASRKSGKSSKKSTTMDRNMSEKAEASLSSKLDIIAEKANKEKGDGVANMAGKEFNPTTDANDDGDVKDVRGGKESPDTIITEEVGDPSCKGESSTMGTGITKSRGSSTYADFMKKMDGFMVENPEHQLVVQVAEHGNVEKLLLQELSYIPKPTNPNEIVIKVDCSTITLQDCMIRRGKWYEMQKLPFVPGSDFVGTIHEMGLDAVQNSTFQVGDKVAAVVPSGGNAKYISMSYQNIIRVPDETDSVMALCLSSTYVPAREALDMARKLNTPFTGANILVIGGNGPSGLATIELALLEGANVYTTADERHHEYLTELGAKCFSIDPNKWLPTLQGKMDVVLDSVCLDGYESSSLAMNPAGTLVCTGMSAVYTQGQIKAFGIMDARDYKATYCRMKAKYLLNNSVYYDKLERYEVAPNEYAQHFRYLCHLASKDTITPLISTRKPLNKVAAIQKAIEHGDTAYGVCVCTPWAIATDQKSDRQLRCSV
mmetsp:Transcript_26393/g.63334  ORF Transcript_26393/g.63334 Transcript_26393/m.63334 type:complete len:868 (-) Transcript_26393:586-3189(-)